MKTVYLLTLVLACLLCNRNANAQISCGMSIADKSGCAPFVLIASATVTSPSTITHQKWRLWNNQGFSYLSPQVSLSTFSYVIAHNTCTEYYLSLWVKNVNGDTCVTTDTVHVIGKPYMQPVVSAAWCAGSATVTLYPNVTTCAGSLDTFAVDWGCGVSTLLGYVPDSLMHIYTCPAGCYSITIMAANSAGCYHDTTLIDAVCLGSTPMAGGYVSNDTLICPNPPQIIQFFDTSATHVSGMWDFGDGNTSVLDTVNHIYTLPGKYAVRRMVCNGVCCDTVVIDTVVVGGPYLAEYDLSLSGLCACEDTLVASLQTVNTESLTYIMGCNTGIGQIDPVIPIGTELNPTTVDLYTQYCLTDSCEIQVILTDTLGCTVFYSLPFVYIDSPVIDFVFDNTGVCNSGVVCFTDSTRYALQHDSTVSWNWSFGDGGGIDTTENPCHYYAQPGVYWITLSIESANGCSKTLAKQVVVYDYPVAAGYASSNVIHCQSPPTLITFYDTSSAHTSGTWHFGTGITSSQDTATYIYTLPGRYYVSRVVCDGGCCDSIVVDTIIVGGPHLNAYTLSSMNVCGCTDTLHLQLQTVGSMGATVVYGCFAGFNTVNNISPTGTAQNPTTLNFYIQYCVHDSCQIQVVLSDTFGCSMLYSLPYVQVDTGTALFKTERQNACIDGVFCFEDLSTQSGIVDWQWNFGDGATSALQDTCHYYTSQGSYVATLTVTSASGCSTTHTDTVKNDFTLNPNPVATSSSSWPNACQYSFTSPGQIATWTWYFDDGGISFLQDPVNTFSTPGQHSAILIVTDSAGCTQSDTVLCMAYVGVNNVHEGELYVKVIPNPFHDYTTINVEGLTESFEFSLQHLFGEKLLVKQGKANEALRVERNALPAGIYMYEVKTRSGLKATGKLVAE